MRRWQLQRRDVFAILRILKSAEQPLHADDIYTQYEKRLLDQKQRRGLISSKIQVVQTLIALHNAGTIARSRRDPRFSLPQTNGKLQRQRKGRLSSSATPRT